MLKEVNIIRVYNLVNAKGTALQLQLGVKNLEPQDKYYGDTGFRWSFVGTEIPMPVRAHTWFNGFPENTMLDWLKANGWYPKTSVDMQTGKAKVYELPKAPSEMETLGTDQFPARSEFDKTVFEHVIRSLVSDGNKARACRVYRYAHGGKLTDALKAVEFIITK